MTTVSLAMVSDPVLRCMPHLVGDRVTRAVSSDGSDEGAVLSLSDHPRAVEARRHERVA